MNLSVFGEQLKKLRIHRGIDPKVIAVDLNLGSSQAYYNFEKSANPEWKTIQKVAHYFEVSEEYFFKDFEPSEFDIFLKAKSALYLIALQGDKALELFETFSQALEAQEELRATKVAQSNIKAKYAQARKEANKFVVNKRT